MDTQRRYCRAYLASDLAAYERWPSRDKQAFQSVDTGGRPAIPNVELPAVLYLHEDLSVTIGIYEGEGVVFESDGPEWRKYCESVLQFDLPVDL